MHKDYAIVPVQIDLNDRNQIVIQKVSEYHTPSQKHLAPHRIQTFTNSFIYTECKGS